MCFTQVQQVAVRAATQIDFVKTAKAIRQLLVSETLSENICLEFTAYLALV